MSLILDALKKLEQEKAARRTRQGDIRPALTARKSSPTSPAWRLPALFTGTMILAVAVTLGVTGLFSQKNLPPSPAPVQFPPLSDPGHHGTAPASPDTVSKSEYSRSAGSPPTVTQTPQRDHTGADRPHPRRPEGDRYCLAG